MCLGELEMPVWTCAKESDLQKMHEQKQQQQEMEELSASILRGVGRNRGKAQTVYIFHNTYIYIERYRYRYTCHIGSPWFPQTNPISGPKGYLLMRQLCGSLTQ